jgi:hypothetical protein
MARGTSGLTDRYSRAHTEAFRDCGTDRYAWYSRAHTEASVNGLVFSASCFEPTQIWGAERDVPEDGYELSGNSLLGRSTFSHALHVGKQASKH